MQNQQKQIALKINQQILDQKLPGEVKLLFEIFKAEIRLVGGCVRDLLLKKKIADFDFATGFLPAKIIKILGHHKIKALETGIKFGTVSAVINGKNFEITTLRRDLKSDGRHCEAQFITDYFFDAARRDFTINALYLDCEGNIYDYFGGIADLKNKKVRFIGDPDLRIKEDFLRILRFFRFSCNYSSDFDKAGLAACIKAKENLLRLSRQRVRTEFLKIIASDNKNRLIATLKILQNKKIIDQIFTAKIDIAAFTQLVAIEKKLKKLKFRADLRLELAVLFLQKNLDLELFFKEIAARNAEKKYFHFLNSHLLNEHFLNYYPGKENPAKNHFKALRQLLAFVPGNLAADLYIMLLAKNFNILAPAKTSLTGAAADNFAGNAAEESKSADNFANNFFNNWPEIEKNLHFLKNFSRPDFPLSGHDMMQLGFKKKMIGEMLKRAKIFWAENDFKADKADLLNFLKN